MSLSQSYDFIEMKRIMYKTNVFLFIRKSMIFSYRKDVFKILREKAFQRVCNVFQKYS